MVELLHSDLRLRALECDGVACVQIDLRDGDSHRTILGNGVVTPEHIWTLNESFHAPDPHIEWREGGAAAPMQSAAGGYASAAVVDGALILAGRAGIHALEMALRPAAPGRVHVTVVDRLSDAAGTVQLGRLMSHFFFIPDGRAAGSAEPLDFAWLPSLHRDERHVCGDHFFRSPAAAVCAGGLYAALAPDLDVFAENCALQHALDLRVFGAGRIEAPCLSYGLCTYAVDGHVYTRHDPGHTAPLATRALRYAFHLLVGAAPDPGQASRAVADFLWEAYGQRYFRDPRPQVLPFADYGRRYTYRHELPRSVRSAVVNGKECAGIDSSGRRGANFHAWENDAHVAFGIRHYAEQWQDAGLQATADGILRLTQQAPRRQGAFPCVYNFNAGRYEGTLFWTARAADFRDGYDAAAMGVTTWWTLYWLEHFAGSGESLDNAIAYARFLAAQQLPSGAIPTYFTQNLVPCRQLRESATTAISGAVLAKVARLTGDAALARAAERAGHFVAERAIATLRYDDFEAYYSCSPKPLHALDYWTGIPAHDTLAIQWACDHMLALHRLEGGSDWLALGERALSTLSLYQQVWNPAHRSGYLYGGFGVMNTDGEWNDGRQARFVPTYADYYAATGHLEYLERAIAACRASFALMDIPENHANDINQMVAGRNLNVSQAAGGRAEPGQGYAGENIHHSGREDHTAAWTGMNWSSGGGLAASAYLERLFGSAWIDGAQKTFVPIDGLNGAIDGWEGRVLTIRVDSALKRLAAPSPGRREIVLKFGRMGEGRYTVLVNGVPFPDQSAADLGRGLTLTLQQ